MFIIDKRRCVDIAVSSIGSIVAGFAAAALYVTSGKSPFFYQQRIGLNGKPFTILKFRTMTNDLSLPPAKRITQGGGKARKYGLDELPQFFAILRGDMSLIGPRPVTPQEDSGAAILIGDSWKLRHTIKPGLFPTSLEKEKWLGMGYTDPRDRLEADLRYINARRNGRTLSPDLRILFYGVACGFAGRIDPQAKIPAPRLPVAALSAANPDHT